MTEPMSADVFAPLPTLEQIIHTMQEVRWSVVMDCLRSEKLTDHGRWVLTNASDSLSRLLREHAERREAVAGHDALCRSVDERLVSSRAALSTLREAVREYLAVQHAADLLAFSSSKAARLAREKLHDARERLRTLAPSQEPDHG